MDTLKAGDRLTIGTSPHVFKMGDVSEENGIIAIQLLPVDDGYVEDHAFYMPAPYRAWCHPCNKGFRTLEELAKHNHDRLNEHQQCLSRSS